MIPGNAFAVGPAPASAKIPVYLLPSSFILAYREGADVFTPEDQVPPFTIEYVSKGSLSADILAGTSELGFGLRIDVIRDGVYGTVLVDRVNMDRDIINLNIEYCPDITEDVADTSSPVDLMSVESCPSLTVATEETSSPLSNLISE